MPTLLNPAFQGDPMSVNVMATLWKAVRELQAEKARIDHQLGALRGLLGSLDGAKGGAVRARSGSHRRRMSVSARRALSQRMKAYWAKRRAGSAKIKPRAAARR